MGTEAKRLAQFADAADAAAKQFPRFKELAQRARVEAVNAKMDSLMEKDSDITRRRVIFIPEQGPTRRGRAKQFIVRHQHVLFYPLLVTEGIGLRTESVKALVRRLPRLTRIEAALISVHLAAYFGAVFYLLPLGKGIAFILTMNLLFGLYIGSVFAPNHKGMPIQMPDEDWDWMTRQVVTSRNIRSSYLTDFLYGGLNYQIEHHLFPAMPRVSLRKARPMTIQYCREIGMPYYEVGVFRSYVEVVIHLYRTTKAYQDSVAGAAYHLGVPDQGQVHRWVERHRKGDPKGGEEGRVGTELQDRIRARGDQGGGQARIRGTR